MPQQHQQGVLWKRRDVFKYRWRPRWFVLHAEQGVLTYYLLSTGASEVVSSGTTMASPTTATGANSNDTMMVSPPPQWSASSAAAPPLPLSPATDLRGVRPRTTSVDSQVSQNSVDYDVVPRGTLDLRDGNCTVRVNDRLSKPEQHFFCFTISGGGSSSGGTTAPDIHLATRTPASRQQWIQSLQAVIQRHDGINSATAAAVAASGSSPPQSSNNNTNNNPGGTQQEALQDFLPDPDTENTNISSDHSLHDNAEADLAWRRPNGTDNAAAEDPAYENLEHSLQEQIKGKIRRFLPVMEETTVGWQCLFERGDGHSAYSKEIPIADSKSLTLIKSMAVLDHPPRQLLNLLLDSTRRGHFETNMKAEERLARLNAYTVLDYYSYEPVWPASSREFAVTTHWQVLQKGSAVHERAVLLLAFSCPEADALRPTVEPRHVRADLIISMVLMRAVSDSQCHYTRILCFDPKVGFSQRLGSYITAQQAGQPAILSQYLQQHEPIPSSRMHGPLEDNAIIRDIVHHLPDALVQPRRIDFTRNHSFSSPALDDDEDNSHLATTLKTDVPGPPPALETQATLLLAPTLIFRILDSLQIPGAMLVFVVLAFWAIRQVYVLHLGEMLPERTSRSIVGPVTCRFTVDLKGAMRFINNKKEEREELGQGTAEVTIVHLVASALARALKDVPHLHRRRVIVPWLWIDHVVDASDEAVSVSISENDGGWVTLENVDRMGIQTLSDLALEADRNLDATESIGKCLVVAPPPADTSLGHFANQIEIHASPLLRAGVVVVAVLGQVRVEKGSKKGRKRPPRSVIDVFLTMKSPSEGDFGTCRRYAEEVAKLLRFPEMLE